MAMHIDYHPGATLLDADELASLVPGHITTQGELNEWEQANIVHARLMADLVVERLRQPRFTWGSRSLFDAGETHQTYITALQAAEARDYAPLLAFARS